MQSIITQIIVIDKQIEIEKQALILMPDFNVCDAFRIFDEREEGKITIDDFKYGLSNLGIIILPDLINLFFKQFDRDGDGLIAYSEFLDLFTPTETYYKQIL